MKNKWIRVFFIGMVVLFLPGCAIRRDSGMMDGNEIMPVFKAERKAMDADVLTELLLGMSVDEIGESGSVYWEAYDDETVHLSLSIDLEGKERQFTFATYNSEYEGAWSCYSLVGLSQVSQGLNDQGNSIRGLFPEEDLDTCSREEAIEACRPYAEALGYTDADVEVYAWNLEYLQETSKERGSSSAPGPGYEKVTLKQRIELNEKLAALEEGSDEYNAVLEEIGRLREQRHDGATHNRYYPWEKKHEAMILTYQQHLSGYDMGPSFDSLFILYVPAYGVPIYLQGFTAYAVIEMIEEVPVISEEAALESMNMLMGYTSEDELEVLEMRLLYASETILEEGTDLVCKAVPCWNIEYLITKNGKTERKRVMLNAQFGGFHQRSPRY